MRRLPVGSEFALVDDDDYDLVRGARWRLVSRGYAHTWIEGHSHYMHRLILGAPLNVYVDHKNHDKLDNRRSNLRFATRSQTTATSKKQSGTTSTYKGVTYNKVRRKWQAQVKVNYKNIYLGLFEQEDMAALAYDRAAMYYFGPFARTNILHQGSTS